MSTPKEQPHPKSYGSRISLKNFQKGWKLTVMGIMAYIKVNAVALTKTANNKYIFPTLVV